jgi:curli production assembly/transport component CsgF
MKLSLDHDYSPLREMICNQGVIPASFRAIPSSPLTAGSSGLATFSKLIAVLPFLLLGDGAQGSEITFKPINPSFGGNPFNDGHLLATANVQNKYTAKREERDLSEQFVRSLQSRLFSGLATQVQEAIFGDDPQDNGTFTVGDQQVSFVRGLEVITLEISNLADGSTTVIEVPVLNVD